MMRKSTFYLMALCLAFSTQLFAQGEPIVLEAEDATLGSDYNTGTDGAVEYVFPLTDFVPDGTTPGNATKVITFEVTFPAEGIYKLYARIRVGSGAANDDSFFYGNGFGSKDPATDADWVTCNNMGAAGYNISDDVVMDEGGASSEIWKWVALSDYTGFEEPLTFTVEAASLTQTFQWGAREDGLDLDKIAFGAADLYYTVSNLDNGEAGSETLPGKEPIGPPLAEGHEKFLGCIYANHTKIDFAGYWNQVVSENAGKWGSVEGTRDVMNWGGLDEAYQFAVDSGYPYRHHNLIWGAQQPGWIAALDPADQYDEIVEWMDTVAKRYPLAWQVEVVNEPLHDPPDDDEDGGYIEALGGAGTSGWDWIIESFRIARSVFSDTTSLLLNDYGIMNSTTNTDAYMEIIKLLVAEDTLLDAIGIQAHGFSHSGSSEVIIRNLDSLGSFGLPIYVTELDIDGETDLKQVNGYMRLIPIFWEHPAVQGITLWGFRPGMWRSDQMAYLIDVNGNERPAMKWLRAYMDSSFVANESVTVTSQSGASAIETMEGTLQMQAAFMPENSTLHTAYWSVSDRNVATIDQNGVLTAVANGTVTVSARSLEYESDVSGTMEITITGQENSVHSIADAGITLFPNPVDQGAFNLRGVENVHAISIMDLSGKQIANYTLNGETEFRVELNVAAGMYVVRLTDNENTYFSKIVVR